MELSYSTSGNTGTLTLIGQLWQKEDLWAVEKAVETVTKENIGKVIVDIDRLSFINSQGLGLIARIHTKLTDNGKKMIIFSPPSSVLEVIEISGFNLFMTIATTDEELKAEITN